jgi:hypothetical protein
MMKLLNHKEVVAPGLPDDNLYEYYAVRCEVLRCERCSQLASILFHRFDTGLSTGFCKDHLTIHGRLAVH